MAIANWKAMTSNSSLGILLKIKKDPAEENETNAALDNSQAVASGEVTSIDAGCTVSMASPVCSEVIGVPRFARDKSILRWADPAPVPTERRRRSKDAQTHTGARRRRS